MTDQNPKFSLDWRVTFGLAVTITWISTGMIYLFAVVGWNNFVNLPTADIGSFLEGAFAPLAFLWLVIGHFMQQKEITANTQATSLQAESARRLELHSQRDSYFNLLELVEAQLGAIASFHYISICGVTGTGEVSSEEFAQMRAQSASGDHSLFIRNMIGLAMNNREYPDKLQDFFFGTEIRKRHSENFTRTFSKILNAAHEVDTDDMVVEALLSGSAAGLLYRIIQQVRNGEMIGLILGTTPTNQAPSPAAESADAPRPMEQGAGV